MRGRGRARPAGRTRPRDPDVDLRIPAQRWELAGHRLDVLGAIAAGGIVGAEARYGSGSLWPDRVPDFPMNTLVVNVVGCLLIGVLMTVITDFVSPHRLVRPFLGVGVLGGFTTFSTYCADTLSLVAAGRPVPALLYLSLTPISALGAVWIGVTGTRLAGIALGPADSPRRSDTAGGGP